MVTLIQLNRERGRPRRPTLLLLATILVGVAVPAADVAAQIQIGFCQGAGGLFEYTVGFRVCCPGPPPVEDFVDFTTGPVPCDDPAAVMAAVNAGIAGLMFDGVPVFGAPVMVGSPVPGQLRFEYPLSAPFTAAECCIVGGNVTFFCGTMSLRINPPCSKLGVPEDKGRPTKLCVDGPAPPGPGGVGIMFVDCPMVTVPLSGGESAGMVRTAIVDALATEGYTVFINPDDKVEILSDCDMRLPLGVDEFGYAGGAGGTLGIEICPPQAQTPVDPVTWGRLKVLFN